MPCFVDATNSRVAGISGNGMFSFLLRSSRPIFEAEFLASLYGIYSHLPYSNKVCLIEIIPVFCIVFEKGVREILLPAVFCTI